MNRFARLIHGFSGRISVAPDWAGETAHPPVDIVQDENGLLAEMEAPGMSRENLAISIDGDRLATRGLQGDLAAVALMAADKGARHSVDLIDLLAGSR